MFWEGDNPSAAGAALRRIKADLAGGYDGGDGRRVAPANNRYEDAGSIRVIGRRMDILDLLVERDA